MLLIFFILKENKIYRELKKCLLLMNCPQKILFEIKISIETISISLHSNQKAISNQVWCFHSNKIWQSLLFCAIQSRENINLILKLLFYTSSPQPAKWILTCQTNNMSLIFTCHIPCATFHFPPATFYLPPPTYHMPPATSYLAPDTVVHQVGGRRGPSLDRKLHWNSPALPFQSCQHPSQ